MQKRLYSQKIFIVKTEPINRSSRVFLSFAKNEEMYREIIGMHHVLYNFLFFKEPSLDTPVFAFGYAGHSRRSGYKVFSPKNMLVLTQAHVHKKGSVTLDKHQN